ncbi:hypothetical protein M422DRAFT_50519 [Sphaerobolus stellatus SS14]|uniref:Uncharacterized protein n=1 Tax=Sphaerobolus stellatus (strain SS14) TaxID=990650 RepID=A0A0C9VJE5_SPHS4|nr:hypothetical protein M422DRAFT_50519 [Sphaerobolus stellatus SS14]
MIIYQVNPITSIEEFKASDMTNFELDLQLMWHRQFNEAVEEEKQLKTKDLKETALKRAIRMLNAREDKEEIFAQYTVRDIDGSLDEEAEHTTGYYGAAKYKSNLEGA